MLNRETETTSPLGVVDYESPTIAHQMAHGRMNTADDILLSNVASSIRRQLPQMKTGPVRSEHICLVGSGPSLAGTEEELRQLVYEGAVLVTLNGAYNWCRERNLQPRTQIVLDARAANVGFVDHYVPRCNYVLASQCAPEVFDAVNDYPDVWIFHAATKEEGPVAQLLDDFYQGQWLAVAGGTTVASRALFLLRMAGYVRFDLFGIDCCWLNDQHHALPQVQNENDTWSRVRIGINDSEETFICSSWHVKQFEDFMVMLRLNGQHFKLAVHGNGLLAYAMQALSAGATHFDMKQEKL